MHENVARDDPSFIIKLLAVATDVADPVNRSRLGTSCLLQDFVGLSFVAKIDQADADAENLKGEIKELEAAIATAVDELKAATKIRNKENADYEAVHMDLSESVDALACAIKVLKSKDANSPVANEQTVGVRALLPNALSVAI